MFEAAEWLKKLCAGLPKWDPPGRKIMVRPVTLFELGFLPT